jgi:hypothetical protein
MLRQSWVTGPGKLLHGIVAMSTDRKGPGVSIVDLGVSASHAAQPQGGLEPKLFIEKATPSV